jgi:hypothetical protein
MGEMGDEFDGGSYRESCRNFTDCQMFCNERDILP